mgnify:CR=1 FL=1
MDETTPPAEHTLPLTCQVTPWYYRRMAMITPVLVGMGCYFLYDGKWGYPKTNAISDQKTWFEKEVQGSFEEAQKGGTLNAWMEDARAKGWPTGTDGEPPKWISYATPRNLPEDPKRYTPEEIEGQFWWGYGTLGMAAVAAIVFLLNFLKKLRLDSDHFVADTGAVVRFTDIFKVDKRKWDDKGLAYAFYRQDGGGPERKAVIDDLKYHQAFKILDSILANFKGELIEKVADAEEDAEEHSSDSAAS